MPFAQSVVILFLSQASADSTIDSSQIVCKYQVPFEEPSELCVI